MLIEANLTHAKHLFETHTIQIFFLDGKHLGYKTSYIK